MAAEAKSLLAERDRLMKEAATLSGSTPAKSATARAGRPKKAKTANAA
jgi:hypothetical protein